MNEKDFRIKLVDVAGEWMNVPYKHRGMTKRGCDCGGMVIGILQQMGFLKNYKLGFYKRDWNVHHNDENQLMERLKGYTREINGSELEAGDCIVFKFGQRGSHMGLYLGKTQFLHVHEAAGKCTIDRISGIAWAKRIRSIHRFDLAKLTG